MRNCEVARMTDAAEALALRLKEVAKKILDHGAHWDISQNMESVLLAEVRTQPLEVQEMVCDAIEEAYTERVKVELRIFEVYKATIAQTRERVSE